MVLGLDNMVAIATYAVISDRVSFTNFLRQILENLKKVKFHGARIETSIIKKYHRFVPPIFFVKSGYVSS